MSNLESRMVTVLEAASDVTDITSTRIYEGEAPQDTPFPYITYFRISGRKLYDLSGYTGLENPHLQIDCWAEDTVVLENLTNAVLDALRAATTFVVGDDDDADVEEPEPGTHRRSLDVSFWNREA